MSAARSLRRSLGNHVPKVMRLAREHDLPAGRLAEVVVSHDPRCRVFRARPCNCDPDVRLVAVHPPADQHERN